MTSFRPGYRISAEPAGIPRRLGAMLYDSLLVLALWISTFLILFPLSGGPIAAIWIQIIAVTELLMFFCYFWIRRGQTLGMRAWRLRIVTTEGADIGIRHALVRLLVAVPSALLFGLGYLWYYVGDRQQTWHDRASGTYVVLLPKE